MIVPQGSRKTCFSRLLLSKLNLLIFFKLCDTNTRIRGYELADIALFLMQMQAIANNAGTDLN